VPVSCCGDHPVGYGCGPRRLPRPDRSRTFDAREQSHDVESREGREHRHGIGLYSQSRIHDSTRRPITRADDNLRRPENCRTMRVLDARDHRQGDGDQGSRLTALSRRCVPETAPTSLLSGMSAAERGADQHGKGAAYLIKPLFCTPRRGARVVVSNAGRMPLSCAAALRRARRTLHKASEPETEGNGGQGSARLT